jgi:hypothetical protein
VIWVATFAIVAIPLFLAWWINLAATGGKYWWRWW